MPETTKNHTDILILRQVQDDVQDDPETSSGQAPETSSGLVKETEDWLREHPYADWQVRFDMIKKLSELKLKTNENHKTKIK